MHEGHRARIRARLDSDTLADHELLEILLFSAMPRRNTNELAHRLLEKYGSLYNVFQASYESLCAVDGVGKSIASFIRTLGEVYQRFAEKDKYLKKYVGKYEADAFLRYAQERYQGVRYEVAEVYLFDKKKEVMKSRFFTTQDFYEVRFENTELFRFLCAPGVKGAVLVHNHPLGQPRRSDADDKMTAKMHLLCNMQNFMLYDHVICAPCGAYSYYLSGELRRMSYKYAPSVMFPGEGEERLKDDFFVPLEGSGEGAIAQGEPTAPVEKLAFSETEYDEAYAFEEEYDRDFNEEYDYAAYKEEYESLEDE